MSGEAPLRRGLRNVAAVAAVALLALFATACGGDEDGSGGESSGDETAAAQGDGPENIVELIEMHPASIVKRYLVASLEGDGETACALLTPAARQRLTQGDGQADGGDATCEQAIAAGAESIDGEPRLGVGGDVIRADQVNSLDLLTTILQTGKGPTASVQSEDMPRPVTLKETDQGWLIERVPGSLAPRGAGGAG